MMEPNGHIAAASSRGSALILTVVLTSLLAIVGVLFVMGARIDKMSTTATTDSRELACAVDTVLAQIEEALVADVPGAPIEPALADKVPALPDDPNKRQEYYDYPDEFNPWLADLEPYAVGSGSDIKYYWRQISNVGGILTGGTRDVLIQDIVGEREPFANPNNLVDPGLLADADGDGMPDAKWFQVPSVMTSKGKRFYAAVRIVDNGGMLNMNTGFWFNPDDPNRFRVDGTSPLQVNVVALAAALGSVPTTAEMEALLDARANNGADAVAKLNLARYEKDVIWRYMDVNNLPGGLPSPYTPFDISDELELRFRYLLDQDETRTRVESCGQFTGGRSVPVSGNIDTWYPQVVNGPGYDRRHIATTYNMDRIVTPRPVRLDDGTKRRKMVNVNTADELTLRSAVKAALVEANPGADPLTIGEMTAQITANLRDYIDDDDEVTVIAGGSSDYLGFERPCIYISEVACRQVRDQSGALRSSYAIELYRPYFEDRDPNPDRWRLFIDNPSSTTDITISFQWTGSRRFHVILAEDPQAKLTDKALDFTDAEEPVDTMPLFGYNRGDYKGQAQSLDPAMFNFETGALISLQRDVAGAQNPPSVDWVRVPEGLVVPDDKIRSLQRDISAHKCVRRLWAPAPVLTHTLGNAVGQYVDTQQPQMIQAHPANRPLTNIGELGRIFRRNAYGVQKEWLEKDILVDLSDPVFSRLFNYLTVMDPTQHTGRPDETRIMGRINVNTAPAFVLAQLPWMTCKGVKLATADPNDPNAASVLPAEQAIVKHRELQGPYRSIGDLMQVAALHALAFDDVGNGHNETPRGPDLTPDTVLNDFEERDLIFTRISDLVTVRSDVFTAYVLVRLGEAGPQKRIIAILDRSGVDFEGGKVRLLAYHPVPDPR